MASSNVRIELLNKENFDTWKIQMEALLVKNDAWSYVNGETVKPEIVVGDEASATRLKKWETADRKAKSDIILSISPTELKQVKGCDTSREVWDKLASIYQSKGPARKATLLKQLTLQRMEDDEDVREHLRKFFDTVDKLSDMEVTINPDLLTVMLLYSLPPRFENFRCAIESRDELPTPEVLRVKIAEEHDARKNDARIAGQGAMIAKRSERHRNPKEKKGNVASQKKPFKFKCHSCGKVGHKASDCQSPTEHKTSAKNPEKGKMADTDDVSVFACVPAKQEVFQAMEATHVDRWCLDSGCTSHLCGDSGRFVHLGKITTGKLSLANNSSTNIVGKGTIRLNTEIEGRSKIVSLEDTLHVPDLRTNLLSVSKITDRGYKVIFDDKSAKVVDRNGATKLEASCVNGLYYVQDVKQECKSAAVIDRRSTRASVEDWHRRMGHLNLKDLSTSYRDRTVLGMDIEDSERDFKCEVCVRGKMTRSFFPKKSNRQTDLLELIHSDVCGPMKNESLGRCRYFVTFIDDCSRWCVVNMIRGKNEVLSAFKQFKALVENQAGRKIKCLQSDNGKEYINRDFDDFLKENGIQRRLTVTHTPEQNGVAERKNRTLVEMARCLLIQSDLSPAFWGEAINTANYIRNRCPTSSLGGKTPFERWTGKTPDVGYFQEFGCQVYSLIREPNKEKFQSRSKKGVFVGYAEDSKAFRIWIPDEHRIDISRDVEFLAVPDGLSEAHESPKVKAIDEDWREVEISAPDDDDRIADVQEVDQDAQPQVVTRRGRGRPRKEMTGLKGRPKKIYQVANDRLPTIEEAEFAYLAEVPINQSLNGPDAEEWVQAMTEEMKSIIKNDTWTLVDRPEGCEVIGSRFVLRNKFNRNGTLERRKARIVARGFSQRPGVDFNQTFAPVARISSIRIMTALAAQHHMKMHHLDVTTAYLNGVLEEQIYMETPRFSELVLEEIVATEKKGKIFDNASSMLQDLKKGDKVCLLKKALYGLRQAGRRWHVKLSQALKDYGLKPSSADPCVFFAKDGENALIATIYVDDILVASCDISKIAELTEYLSSLFQITDFGEVNYCLGIEFHQDKDRILMSQEGYINDILSRFGMEDSKPVSTPLDCSVKLKKDVCCSTVQEKDLPYRELIGMLMYLSVCTRPDIAYTVSYLGQFNCCYNETHWKSAKRVLRYLKGTSKVGLCFKRADKDLIGYADADWANCLDDRRSYTGYVFTLFDSIVSWESRKQRTTALSSTEAEYMAISDAVKEAIYLQRFIKDLGFQLPSTLKIFNDNNGARKLAENPVFHARTKHIDVRHHFVREVLNSGILKIEYAPTEIMPADILTKGLPKPKHEKCIDLLGLVTV
ncbi:retrovirus-related gag-pol polyprotein [Lasius niger]|uniref:Retrovirus-related gag-pol polyprotein n=1 Tax=Lasius niger TaxID=67767 RepID=A0A0J7KDR3_LASNI|nr:retrovirus-related gag-pol polyprotein [Lasius niger]KMQ89488.1 retrovirus-related gag-pol polyprotein [Lasius niger]